MILELSKPISWTMKLNCSAAITDWLNFLYVAKDLNLETDDFLIRNGQLLEARLGSRYYHFPADFPEYRPNETLALPLAKCDEMKIIYDYIRELNNASKA